jgi:serine/threonine protein kinase
MSDAFAELQVFERGSGELTRLRSGSLVLGRYQVRSLIGAGAMGTVYLAERLPDRRAAAIKVEHFDEEGLWRGRLEREAQALRSVSHRNVAAVLDHGVLADGRVAVAFDYVDGESLDRVLRGRGGALPWTRAAAIAVDVLDGLGAAHEAGLLHRDVKPSNVLIGREPESHARLIDFGFCKSESLASLTQEFDVVGTPDFMAPERCNDEPYDQRSDLYSVGVLLYHSLTGVLPFGASGLQSVLQKSAGVAPQPMALPTGRDPWPSALDAAVSKALSFAPTGRFASAAEFAATLRALCR